MADRLWHHSVLKLSRNFFVAVTAPERFMPLAIV